MPVPAECQPIADALANLRAQEQGQVAALAGLAGVDKWRAMEQLGTLRQQISDQQAALAQCLKDHADDLTAQVVVFDLPGNSGPNRIARAWQLASTGTVLKQTASLDAGQVTLTGILGPARQSFGITIEEVNHQAVNGPDFRSGLPPVLAAVDGQDPVARIELVILDPIVITSDSLAEAAPPLPLQLSFAAGSAGTISITVNALNITMNAGTILFTASGTASLAGGFPAFSSTNFTFSNSLHVAPTFGMAPGTIFEALSGAAPVLSMSGIVGALVGTITPLLASSLADRAAQPLVVLLNRMVLKRVATNLGLTELPAGVVLSVRELSADNDNITLTPVLGAFGTILSNFQPAALVSAAKLSTLTLEASSLSTGDPIKSSTLAHLSLDSPASAGGVTVLISSDRPDVISISPSSLLIGEGASDGSFTLSAIAQPLTAAANVDATIRASLGTQTLSTLVTVRPEPPATVVTSPMASVSAPPVATDPSARRPGVMSIELFTPPPLPRSLVPGRVTLDGLTNQTVTGMVTFSPSVAAPIPLTFPPSPGALPACFFSFTPSGELAGNSLRITATIDGGATKSIDVPVASS
jgi:hypothetical protein